MKALIKRDIHDLIPKHITKEDILASINYNMHLEYGMGTDAAWAAGIVNSEIAEEAAFAQP